MSLPYKGLLFVRRNDGTRSREYDYRMIKSVFPRSFPSQASQQKPHATSCMTIDTTDSTDGVVLKRLLIGQRQAVVLFQLHIENKERSWLDDIIDSMSGKREKEAGESKA